MFLLLRHHALQRAQEFYAPLKGDAAYSGCVERLSQQPVRAFVLSGHGAIESWLAVVDATQLNRVAPFLHASISRVDANREIDFFFGGKVCFTD